MPRTTEEIETELDQLKEEKTKWQNERTELTNRLLSLEAKLEQPASIPANLTTELTELRKLLDEAKTQETATATQIAELKAKLEESQKPTLPPSKEKEGDLPAKRISWI